MIPAHLMTADVTLHYRGPVTVNSYNQVSRVGVGGSSSTVKGYFRPRRSNTIVDGGDILKSDASIIVQADVVLDNVESVLIDGDRFEPDGDPMPHWNPLRSRIEYQRLDLRRGSN